MKVLKAFTLLEITLGMVVMSFVIGFAYSALTMIQQNASNHESTQAKLLELNRFHALFERDFDVCLSVRSNNAVLEFERTDGKVIQYDFDEAAPLRRDGLVADTFRFETDEMQCFFQREPQYIAGQLVDEFQLIAYVEDEPYYYRFYKSYAADMLLENEAKHEH